MATTDQCRQCQPLVDSSVTSYKSPGHPSESFFELLSESHLTSRECMNMTFTSIHYDHTGQGYSSNPPHANSTLRGIAQFLVDLRGSQLMQVKRVQVLHLPSMWAHSLLSMTMSIPRTPKPENFRRSTSSDRRWDGSTISCCRSIARGRRRVYMPLE